MYSMKKPIVKTTTWQVLAHLRASDLSHPYPRVGPQVLVPNAQEISKVSHSSMKWMPGIHERAVWIVEKTNVVYPMLPKRLEEVKYASTIGTPTLISAFNHRKEAIDMKTYKVMTFSCSFNSRPRHVCE